tara:strand:+ start:398 stop:610 length:213 start_codon:yes stop_codon:yes gene_type:complete
MTTLFPRKHQFHGLSIREQYEFAREMKNAWSKLERETFAQAEKDGLVTKTKVGEIAVAAHMRAKYAIEWL